MPSLKTHSFTDDAAWSKDGDRILWSHLWLWSHAASVFFTKIVVGIKIRQRTDEKCRKDQNKIDLKYDRANL